MAHMFAYCRGLLTRAREDQIDRALARANVDAHVMCVRHASGPPGAWLETPDTPLAPRREQEAIAVLEAEGLWPLVSPRYTTRGSVRGSCGHEHRSLEAAVACLQRDQHGCSRAGGYSDRRVVRSDGATLTSDEMAALSAIVVAGDDD